MKILVTKCMCDICGKEVSPNEKRYMIGFATGNWIDDEIDSSFTECKKDVCGTCYKTIRALINETETQKSVVEVKKVEKRARGSYDKNLIIDLWKKGFSHAEIENKTGASKAQVNYVIKGAIRNGEMQDKKMRIIPKVNSNPKYKTVVDESGLVLSIEES